MSQSYTLKIWTGPTLVTQLAEKIREAGIQVSCEGTEHVHVIAEGTELSAAAWNVLVSLVNKHGTDFGLRPRKA